MPYLLSSSTPTAERVVLLVSYACVKPIPPPQKNQSNPLQKIEKTSSENLSPYICDAV